MIDIKAVYDESEKTITLSLTYENNTEDIVSTVRSSGTFRFSYHHHELEEADSYTGMLISNNKVMIYPAYGIGVISDKPIEVESV